VARAASPKFWLLKSEPETYSIIDLEHDDRGTWEGVRNYQARNHLRAMPLGDLALFYHSNAEPPGVMGVARVVGEARPDPTAFDPGSDYHDPSSDPANPRWVLVDVEFVERLPQEVSLELLKQDPALEGMLVRQRGQRLSVQPVTRKHFARVLQLGGARMRV